MLRIHTSTSSGVSKNYFSSADYYSEGQELVGVWHGKGAVSLGLHGNIAKSDWDQLCDNINPRNEKPLTPRQKTERRVGYDFTFDVPKSVSLLYGLTRDERLLDAFRESVGATMQEIEAEAKTRIRRRNDDTDRVSGNLTWGEYVHFTSRPVDGVPDPQLHAHCFVFNATWDKAEDRWKALQIGDIKRDAPYFQAAFNARMASKLADLGLPIERTRHGWDLKGFDKSTLDKFSRRTLQIEAAARKLGICDPREKAELGAKIRERKVKTLSMDELRHVWFSRLTEPEADVLGRVGASIGSKPFPEQHGVAKAAVRAAAEHCFERSSVVPERTLLTEALKRSFGKASLNAVNEAHNTEGFLIAEFKGRRMATTQTVLKEEAKMLSFARSGRAACRPINPSYSTFHNNDLNAEQRAAVLHVLESRDRVTLVRGAAGVGKTFMMKEARHAIEAAGKKLFAFAPSASASRDVLRSDGFESADTVARLLIDQKLHTELAHSIIWIDEAGLVGTKTMSEVFDLADRCQARLVLSGDRRQHGSVERGAALRLLEEEAGLKPAEIKEIQRQKDKYMLAVKDLSDGNARGAFKKLDDLGWIHQIATSERYKALATAYVDSVKAQKSALVVSPTHAEGERITTEIRSQLREHKLLGVNEREYGQFIPANLTQAQKADPGAYEKGDVLIFHQNAKGFSRGQMLIAGRDNLPFDQAERFSVFRARKIGLSVGDKIRITRGGQTAVGNHRLNTGDLFSIKKFARNGDLVLENNWVISKDFGHLAHGLVVTSHASQGKSVKRVLIGQSFESLPAASREQFYVSVSRGKEQVVVYTDNKKELLKAVSRSDERISGTELMKGCEPARRRNWSRATQHAREMLPFIQRSLDREAIERGR